MCVCVCVCARARMCMNMYMCACVCVCAFIYNATDIVTLARYICSDVLMYALFYLVDRPCLLFVVRALSESSSF